MSRRICGMLNFLKLQILRPNFFHKLGFVPGWVPRYKFRGRQHCHRTNLCQLVNNKDILTKFNLINLINLTIKNFLRTELSFRYYFALYYFYLGIPLLGKLKNIALFVILSLKIEKRLKIYKYLKKVKFVRETYLTKIK